MSVEKILEERQKTHGSFVEHSGFSQGIKQYFQVHKSWHTLSHDKQEAIDMIVHKLARVMSGNPEVKDHWEDIAGYATLVANTLKEPNAPYER